jgi:hypothetical protein
MERLKDLIAIKDKLVELEVEGFTHNYRTGYISAMLDYRIISASQWLELSVFLMNRK